jgi:hypothetical protein
MSTKYRYISVIVKLQHKGESKSVSVKFSNDGMKIFFNARHIYLTISSEARCWFEFICETAGLHGRVYVGKVEEENFIKHAMEITASKVNPTVTKINNHTRKLVEIGLLLKTKHSGLFYVNPKYVQLTTAKQRENDLNYLFNNADLLGLEVGKMLDRPLADFFENS